MTDTGSTHTTRDTVSISRTRSCRYFQTPSGCRAGASCPFKHEPAPDPAVTTRPPAQRAVDQQGATGRTVQRTLPVRRQYQAPPVDPSRVVQRPVPAAQLENPREFQLGQIRRRFNPTETAEGQGTSCVFKLSPSDPDFPFEIEALQCILFVPLDYPEISRPKLRITNKDIPRGFAINLEQGFDEIANASKNATLLGLLNRLDKALEELLTRPMAETIKLYKPAGAPPKPAPKPNSASVPLSQPNWTETEKQNAASKRQAEIRQLVARLGKQPGFVQSQDGVTFTMPPTVFRTSKAPVAIARASSLRLIVPELYPLVACRIQFEGSLADEARNVEAAFEVKAKALMAPALLAQINHLSLNLAQMAASQQPVQAPVVPPPQVDQPANGPDVGRGTAAEAGAAPTDKPHVHIIPRPIEWMQPADENSGSGSESYTDSSDDEYGTEDAQEEEEEAPRATSGVVEKGVLLSFPNLELHGIELLELTSLGLTIKCTRCKDQSDISNLRPSPQPKDFSCKKCASALSAGYRMDMMHAASSRAGYLDLEGCTSVDLLPSSFVPTCSTCSTAYATACSAVRGDAALAVCRECHARLSFRIHEVKFLPVGGAAERAARMGLRRRTQRENLGIVVGTELPRRGKCQHYAKSYRWFRFGCCQKVYPCDRCHMAADSDHVVEFANRMICGYCSREQNYRPEDCGVCHAVLVGKKGSGFWEGGKGTRDPLRMSRKDPRKYKRRPGSKPVPGKESYINQQKKLTR